MQYIFSKALLIWTVVLVGSTAVGTALGNLLEPRFAIPLSMLVGGMAGYYGTKLVYRMVARDSKEVKDGDL